MNIVLRTSNAIPAFDSVKLPGCNAPAVWIGFVDSYDSVASYEFMANGQSVYTQNNAHNEAFITSCGVTEAVKKADIFSKARHKDVWRRADTCKSGFVIDFNNVAANSEITCTIPIKIDLRRFLILDSVRFLPAFAGNIQLKVKFSSEALQVAPLSLEDCLQNLSNLAKVTEYPKLTNKFVPFEEAFTMIGSLALTKADGTTAATSSTDIGHIAVTTSSQTLTRKSCAFDTSFSYLYSFSLDPNVYTELVNRYTRVALSFPIKRFDWTTMTGNLNLTSQSKFTATVTPMFVNSIFVLFKKRANYYSNYENPIFKSIQLKMGAYGNIPSDAVATNSQVFYETCANALNTNNDLCGFNTDVARSLTSTGIVDTGYESNDTTHFFVGFPTETDFTFMQGQTSNSPITYELMVNPGSYNALYTSTPPEIGFLKHCCLSIQVNPVGSPKVVIDDYDLSLPQGD